MKLKEIINEVEKGIFEIFHENMPNAFAALFPNITVNSLDALVLLRFGERETLSFVSCETFANLVLAVISEKLESWEHQRTAYNENFVLNAGETETKTKTGNVTRNATNTETTLNAEKVFNDVDFVDGEKSNTNEQNNNTEIYNLTETNIKTVGNVLDNIKREIYFRRENNFYKTVANDIVSEITMQIYV